MCWVMPPASPATTLAERILSSSVVLPWSTWPMTVIDRRPRLLVLLVVGVVEQRLELDLLLLARLDEEDLGADLEGEQLHLLVRQRHRRRDHLAVVEQEADDVGRRAVQLRAELLGRDAALDDDGALGDRRVAARVVGELRLQLLAVATTTTAAAAARRAALAARPGTRATWRTAGTSRATGTGRRPPGRPLPGVNAPPPGRAPPVAGPPPVRGPLGGPLRCPGRRHARPRTAGRCRAAAGSVDRTATAGGRAAAGSACRSATADGRAGGASPERCATLAGAPTVAGAGRERAHRRGRRRSRRPWRDGRSATAGPTR